MVNISMAFVYQAYFSGVISGPLNLVHLLDCWTGFWQVWYHSTNNVRAL